MSGTWGSIMRMLTSRAVMNVSMKLRRTSRASGRVLEGSMGSLQDSTNASSDTGRLSAEIGTLPGKKQSLRPLSPCLRRSASLCDYRDAVGETAHGERQLAQLRFRGCNRRTATHQVQESGQVIGVLGGHAFVALQEILVVRAFAYGQTDRDPAAVGIDARLRSQRECSIDQRRGCTVGCRRESQHPGRRIRIAARAGDGTGDVSPGEGFVGQQRRRIEADAVLQVQQRFQPYRGKDQGEDGGADVVELQE